MTQSILRDNYLLVVQTLENHRAQFQTVSDDAARKGGKSYVLRHFVFQDLSEIATILGLLVDRLGALQEVSVKQNKLWQGRQRGEIPPDSDEWQLLSLRMLLNPQVRVLIKTLYVWFFHLREDLEASPTLKALVPGSLWLTLDRLCTVRNALITHKSGLEVIASGGTRSGPDVASIEILMVPIVGIPATMLGELEHLFEKARPYMDPKDGAEKNVYERMGLLYRRLDLLPGELRGDIKRFLTRYGTIFDTPQTLSTFVKDLVVTIGPMLAKQR